MQTTVSVFTPVELKLTVTVGELPPETMVTPVLPDQAKLGEVVGQLAENEYVPDVVILPDGGSTVTLGITSPLTSSIAALRLIFALL